MKQIKLIFGTLIAVGSFAACNNSSDKGKQEAAGLTKYVDSVDMVTPVYTTENWTAIDNGYATWSSQVDMNNEGMADADKKSVENSRARYAALKAKYEAAIKEKEDAAKMAAAKPDYKQVLRGKLFGEGKVGSDVKMSFITADNLKDTYEKFVNTVDDNKNEYSREDWDEIKVLYEALDSRKNEVEKDLSTKDNLRIAALKVKFAAIKSVKRPMAKAEENAKAKD